jgi:hypothetical protein
MKISQSSVLFCAVVSMTVGCQPELASPFMDPLAFQAQAVEGESGSWVRTAPLVLPRSVDGRKRPGNGPTG